LEGLQALIERSLRFRAFVVAGLLVAGLVVLTIDATAFEDPATGHLWEEPDRWWAFNPLETPGDSLYAAIPTFANVRTRYPLYIGMYAGLAARSIAGGRPESIIYPTPLSALTVLNPENARQNPVKEWYLEALSGYNAHQEVYPIRVSQDVIDEWENSGRLIESEWNVWLVRPDSPEGLVVLHQDPRGHRLFVVPESLSPVFGSPEER
jgi:hypothetical protein